MMFNIGEKRHTNYPANANRNLDDCQTRTVCRQLFGLNKKMKKEKNNTEPTDFGLLFIKDFQHLNLALKIIQVRISATTERNTSHTELLQ